MLATTPAEARSKPVTVSFTNVSAAQALAAVSQLTGIPVAYEPPAKDPVLTITFKNVPADQVFNALAELVGKKVAYEANGVTFIAAN